MVKKVVIVGGLVLLVGLLLFGTSAVSYVRTSAGYVSDSVSNAWPIEFKIQQARDEIKALAPEIRKNVHLIGREEARVKELGKRIAEAEKKLAKDKENMLRLQSDLASANDSYRYAGREYTAEQVRTDLSNRFARFKTSNATLDSWRQMHAAQKQSVEAARQKLEGTLAAKRQAEVEVENLEAKLHLIAAAKASSAFQFDDSRLGQVKELIAGLQQRVAEESAIVDVESRFHDEIPLDEPTSEDIVEQIAEYFDRDQPEREDLAKK